MWVCSKKTRYPGCSLRYHERFMWVCSEMVQSGTVSSFPRYTITFPQPQHAEETSSLTLARCSMPAPKSTQGRRWPQLLGCRQLNQGESSLTPQDLHPLLGNESQTEKNISVKIALGLCLTWPPTQSTRLGLLSAEEPASLERRIT